MMSAAFLNGTMYDGPVVMIVRYSDYILGVDAEAKGEAVQSLRLSP